MAYSEVVPIHKPRSPLLTSPRARAALTLPLVALAVRALGCIGTGGLTGGGSEPDAATPEAGPVTPDAGQPDVAQPDAESRCGPKKLDCLGGACVDGRCEPVMLAAAEPNDLVVTLELDATSFYYATKTGGTSDLVRCAKAGCATSRQLVVGGVDQPQHLTVRGGNLYFSMAQSGQRVLARCPTTGCAAPTVLSAPTGIGGRQIAITDDAIYYLSGSELRRCDIGGCAASTTLVLGGLREPEGLAVANGELVVAESDRANGGAGGRVTTTPVGGPAVSVGALPFASHVRATDRGALVSTYDVNGGSGGIYVYSSVRSTVVDAPKHAYVDTAYDGTSVFYSTYFGPLYRVRLGELPETLVTAEIHGIGADERAVYFTAPRGTPARVDGRVFRLAK